VLLMPLLVAPVLAAAVHGRKEAGRRWSAVRGGARGQGRMERRSTSCWVLPAKEREVWQPSRRRMCAAPMKREKKEVRQQFWDWGEISLGLLIRFRN